MSKHKEMLKKNDGAFLVEMMVALGILAVVSLSATTVFTTSSLGTRSTDLGSQFNTDTSLVQQLLNNPTSCSAGFFGVKVTSLINSSTAVNLSKIPMVGNSVIKENVSTPGLEYTSIQIDKILEKISGTSYLMNIHLDAKKISNKGMALPGNSNYTKDLPFCMTLNTDMATIKSCGPPSCNDATITGVAVGVMQTCAVTDAGVKCWGSNLTNFSGDADPIYPPSAGPVANFDALGTNSTPNNSSVPLAVNNLAAGSTLLAPAYQQGTSPSYKEIDAGQNHTCVQTAAGGLYCWGNVQGGQLGTAGLGPAYLTQGADATIPVQLPAGSVVVDFKTSTDAVCAVLKNGLVYCWGCNYNGELARGQFTPQCGGSTPLGVGGSFGDTNTPEAVLDSSLHNLGATQAVNLIGGGFDFFCAIWNNYTHLSCWGECDNGSDLNPVYNAGCSSDGAGNNGDAQAWDRTSSFPPTVKTFTAMAGGEYGGCALTQPFSRLYCWGENDLGEVGVLPFTGTLPPTLTASGVTEVHAEGKTVCATIAGALNCWGDNTYGQLGRGGVGIPAAGTPAPVIGLPTGTVSTFSVGRFSVCAVIDSSQLYCWGANGYYMNMAAPPTLDLTQPFFNLGNSSSLPTGVPKLVQGL